MFLKYMAVKKNEKTWRKWNTEIGKNRREGEREGERKIAKEKS